MIKQEKRNKELLEVRQSKVAPIQSLAADEGAQKVHISLNEVGQPPRKEIATLHDARKQMKIKKQNTVNEGTIEVEEKHAPSEEADNVLQRLNDVAKKQPVAAGGQLAVESTSAAHGFPDDHKWKSVMNMPQAHNGAVCAL